MRKAIFWIIFVVSILASGCISPTAEIIVPTATETAIIPTETMPPPTATQELATSTNIPPTPRPTITLTSPPPTPWPTHTRPMPIAYFIGFRTDRPPFDDVLVRRAFAQAIDRRKLADDMWVNGSQPATSLVPPQIWPDGRSWYREIGLYTDSTANEPVEAVEMEWDGIIRVSIPEGTERMGQLLREQWQVRLGIVVDIEVFDSDQYDLLIDSDDSQMYFHGWYADYASPYNFLGDAIAYNAQWLKWSNEEYDRLIEVAFSETDVDQQIDLYVQAERILCEEDAVIAPLFHDLFYP